MNGRDQYSASTCSINLFYIIENRNMRKRKGMDYSPPRRTIDVWFLTHTVELTPRDSRKHAHVTAAANSIGNPHLKYSTREPTFIRKVLKKLSTGFPALNASFNLAWPRAFLLTYIVMYLCTIHNHIYKWSSYLSLSAGVLRTSQAFEQNEIQCCARYIVQTASGLS